MGTCAGSILGLYVNVSGNIQKANRKIMDGSSKFEEMQLFQEALYLPIGKRLKLASAIIKSVLKDGRKATAESRFEKIKSLTEDVLQLEIKDRRYRNDVLARTFIAYIMYNEGFSLYQIGKLIKKDHSTVMHYVNRTNDMISVPSFYTFELEKLNEIIKLLNEDDNKIQEAGGGCGNSVEGASV